MKLLRAIEIAADNNYKVGDVIAFTLTDGEEVEAMAVKQEQDGMIFCLVDCLNLAYYMNLEDSNRGGYAATAMRAKLNGEILTRFPPDIREKMIAFASGDYLRLPTEKEIFGCNEYGKAEPGNVVQWEPMKQQRNRIAFWGKGTNQWVRYWLQNAYTWKCLGKRYNSYFVNVDVHGCVDYMGVSELGGVRSVFKLANPSLSV